MIVGNRGTPLLRGTKPIGYNSAYVAEPQHLILRYTDGVIPDIEEFRWPATGTQISVLPNIWDVYVPSTLWTSLLRNQYELLEVIDANFENVTKADEMCRSCTKLTAIYFSNTDKVLDMSWMFCECESLISVPLFDTSNVTNMDIMFRNCTNVQTGALALYQQASTQTNPPSNHDETFRNCGTNTQTGSAELAQIPDDWK